MTMVAHEAELGRSLKTRHVSMIAIGGIIGAGLFVGSSTTISLVGPAAVASYCIAGLIILLVMRMISEIASAHPGIKSFPDFARLGLGHWAGFVSGWLYWYFWVVVVAIEAIAGAKIINGWLPQLPVWAIGTALMTILTASNFISVRAYGEFEFWLSSIKVVAIVAFIALTSAWLFGVMPHQGSGLDNLFAHGGLAPAGISAVFAAVASTIFALCGAEIATIAAAESADSARIVSKLALTVTVRILIFYVLSIFLIVACVPWTQIRPGYSPFATALAGIGVPYGDRAMNAVVLVAVLSCLNSGLYVTSRTLFGLARFGDAPDWLIRVNAHKVPVRAILCASLFSYGALAAERLAPDFVFSFLVNSSGVSMLFLYLLVAAAQLRLRIRHEQSGGAPLPVKMWFHPYGTIFAIAAMILVIGFMGVSPDLRSQFLSSIFVTILLMVIYIFINWRTDNSDISELYS